MRTTYWRDDARRRVEIVSDGPFDADAFIAAMHRQRREGVWGYAMLSDTRRMVGTPRFEDLLRIRAAEAECGADAESAGPLVIIAFDGPPFRKACEYAVLAATHRPINVVEDRADAEQWLHERGF